MALALGALLDRRKLALTRAKFRAWWEGEPFDEAAALAAIEAGGVANDHTGDADDALFDAPEYEMPPRLAALSVMWGEGRIRPGVGAADDLDAARMGLKPDGVLAVLGPGLAGPLISIAKAHPGRIEVFEWRDETREALKHGVMKAGFDDRISISNLDLEAFVFTPNAFDALLSTDDFAYCGYPPHLAQQIMKGLKPGACAFIEAYVGFKSSDLATAFASSFAEPQIRPHGDILQFFIDAGLQVEADEDFTEAFLFAARDAFRQLGEKLAEAAKLDVASVRELAWEAEAWRARMRLLGQRRLERRRFLVRKPVEGQPENANAPAG